MKLRARNSCQPELIEDHCELCLRHRIASTWLVNWPRLHVQAHCLHTDPSGPCILEISLGASSQHFLKPSTFDLADGRYMQTRIAFHVQA
ncbi:hypothetical protein MRX96_008444 [Rhipicephalus microplus]